jgi:phospholipid/cholesterol/gamma-HCH transport system substrate-binding protein
MIIGVLLATLSGPLPTGWLPWGRHAYRVGVKVDKAPGVDQNTPVRKNGILIGRVKSIEEQPDGMLIRAEIHGDRPLYPEYEPHIRTTVIGDATIDFEFDFRHKRLPADAQRVPDGYEFKGIADESPFDAIAKFGNLKDDFSAAARSLNQAGEEVSKLAKNLNETLGEGDKEGQLSHLVQTTDRAMAQFERTMSAFNEIFGDVPADGVQTGVARPPVTPQAPFESQPRLDQQPPPFNQPQPPAGVPPAPSGPEMRQRLRQSLNDLPDAIREFRTTMNDFRVVLESANRNLKNLEGFTEPLGQKGADFASALLKAVDSLDQLVVDFNSVAQALSSRRGTIGRLLYDEGKAYDNFNILMTNANTVLQDIHDLAFYLKPILKDARIFMDKIATEPGRLVTGGLNPSPVK